MNERLINFIENSFLSEYLKMPGVTDISYNGVSFFYMHNKEGRKKANLNIQSTEVLDFIRQIANFSERQFSVANPYLDIGVGKYRINAVHTSIVRVINEKSCSFALRIGSEKSLLENDFNFLDKKCRDFLSKALSQHKSIVIAGATGSGKTELQKYLLTNLRPFERVIVIDNIEELENVRVNDDIDLTMWQISQSNPNASAEELIRNALRSNPDWLVMAEARGKEMSDVFLCVTTGHPIITTLHAETLEDIPLRITRLIESGNTTEKFEDILSDVYEHFKILVFLKRKIKDDGSVVRYIESIAETQKDKTLKIIYRRKE